VNRRLWLLSALLVTALAVWSLRGHLALDGVLAWIEQAGPWGPVVFMLLYALGTLLFVPGLALTLAGGALFGPWLGTLCNLGGALLGSTLAFLLARYLAADWVEARLGGRLRQIKRGVEAEGWRFVAFVRLVPLFPFILLNYALGLTRIPLPTYVLVSAFAMLPAAAAYTWLGHAGRAAVEGSRSLAQTVVVAGTLLALVLLLPRLVASLRRGPTLSVDQLRERVSADNDLLLLDVRSAEELQGELGHLAGVRHIPLERLAEDIDQLGDWMERPLAILCRTDVRSAKAARLLVAKGFADVHVVKGGMVEWNARGWPVERTPPGD
jgi:uncharacterized membrane protein YdjX (TVP38/TMEM64 family)/rhodanese-related sulfurtransferase